MHLIFSIPPLYPPTICRPYYLLDRLCFFLLSAPVPTSISLPCTAFAIVLICPKKPPTTPWPLRLLQDRVHPRGRASRPSSLSVAYTTTVKMNSVEKCQHYGRFLSQLDRPAAEGLYWILFSLVIILLFACSWNYGRMMEKIEGLGTENRRRQRLLHKSFWAAIIGGLIACGCGFLAAFTLLTLQFCDEEPLASLYWSTWTVLVVGGIVAIFGISLHIRHLIKSRRPPPWALALGTPVLVVAGLGHYFQGKISSKARRLVSRSREAKRTKKVDGDTDLEGE